MLAYLAAYGADNPAMTGGLCSLDIASSSYLAKLTFLSQRLIHLNRNAECGNQSLNSMALASARYTLDAVDLLTTMCASTLLAACQALELRRLSLLFFRRLSKGVLDLFESACHSTGVPLSPELQRDTLFRVFATWNGHWPVQLEERVCRVVEAAITPIAVSLLSQRAKDVAGNDSTVDISAVLTKLTQGLEGMLTQGLRGVMDTCLDQTDSNRFDGDGLDDLVQSEALTQVLQFVRHDLGIPLDAGGGLDAMHSPRPQHAFATYGHSVTELAAAFRNRRIDALWHRMLQAM